MASLIGCIFLLLQDSDNLPTQAPELFFDQPNYKRLGAMFWVDYWKTSASNPMWHILGVQCRDEWEQEAGQILIDKRRHLDAMLLSQYMLIDWQYWYYFSDGDKDVFRFAFLGLRKRWALPGRYVGAAGLPSGTASGDFCSHTMQQFDNAGRPAFVHYNLLKQIPSGVGRGFSWGRTKQVTAFPDPPLRPITKAEFLEAGLNNTEKWWEPDSVPYRQETRYALAPYPDPVIRDGDDVEADMLANAKDDGRAIQPASSEVRRRAAYERGVRPFFHGGSISALCIDLK
jgi:alpha 1,2-mannosyltransferase